MHGCRTQTHTRMCREQYCALSATEKPNEFLLSQLRIHTTNDIYE